MDTNQLLTQLQIFFPSSKYTADNIEQFIRSNEIDTSLDSIANALKGALFDETIIEVQLQDIEGVFYCRILDNPFDETLADEDGNLTIEDPNYEKASYLDYHESLILTPLEPSKGNYFISAFTQSEVKVLLRIISSGNAVELGCFFEHRTILGDMPCLKLTFPLVARKTTEAREFRAKVSKKMSIVVTIDRLKKKPVETSPLNISLHGMSLLDPMKRRSNLQVGEKVVCNIQIPKELPIVVDASIIHITNLRDSKGTQYCFGINFHFANQTTKTAIEKAMALVQRNHLRELADIEEQFGVIYEK